MGTEFETVEGRITSMLSHLQSEYGILERLVYKNKNQHRRCSYFQHLLKVRRDLKLLQLANLEELVTSCFFVIKGDRPKQKIHLLESLKRRKCNDERHNFLERLLGSARLLAEMVEPILKAATEISVLFARSFFMGLSVTIMALLARLRVLVQQILLDVVYLFNMVSSLSRNKQSVKITHERIEVFREFYPVSDDYVTLECVWKSDKYILHERKHKRESESRGEDSGGNLCVQASSVNYNTIESILGDDQLVPDKGEVDAALKEDPPHVKDMNIDLVNTDLLTSLSKFDDVKETVFSSEEGRQNHCAAKVSFCESSPEGGSHALPQSSTSGKFYSSSKKVAFVSIKNPTLVPESVQSSISVLTSNAKAKPFHFIGNESAQTKDDKSDSLASILTNVNAKDSIF
ncbi:uncharacterized protein [Cicer arietinum]|uniref:Uncharacterized protein LOC101503684 isoform X1 n=1 Tax=Cicer arietinum TaxID=3827 RepID=A0A1S2YXB8_CICAR|nr:uncharacterized protein LOC101503684 isoform X1 [Cicer arietinum]